MLLSDIFLFVFQRTSSPIIWGLTQLKSPFNSLSKQPTTPPPKSAGVKLKKGEEKVGRVSININ